MCVDEEDSDKRIGCSRRTGPQPESQEKKEVGGEWIVGDVEELNEEQEEEAQGADPETGNVIREVFHPFLEGGVGIMEVSVMGSVKFVTTT